MVLQLTAEAREEWRSHWKLAAVSTVGASMMAMAVTALGAYIGPLEQEFGWKRAEISMGLTIFALAGVIFSPLLGGLVDRWGPRRFGVPGVALCGAAFALFASATSSIIYWLVLWFIYSAIAQIPRAMVWSSAVSSEFKASRGLAISSVLAGGSFGSLIAPVIAGHLIDKFGWRLSYVITGVCWGGLAWVLSYFFFHSRADKVGATAADANKAPVLEGVSAREALLSATFLKFAAATFVVYVVIMGLLVHMIPLLIGAGIARADATWIAGLMGFAAMGGVLLAGALADRLPGHFVYAGFMALLAIAWPIHLIKTEFVMIKLVACVAQGIAGGAQSHLLPYLMTRYFGLRAFGKIYGTVASLLAVGVGTGPPLAGYIYDHTHSYDLLVMIGVPAALVSALLLLTLGRYPDDLARPRKA